MHVGVESGPMFPSPSTDANAMTSAPLPASLIVIDVAAAGATPQGGRDGTAPGRSKVDTQVPSALPSFLAQNACVPDTSLVGVRTASQDAVTPKAAPRAAVMFVGGGGPIVSVTKVNFSESVGDGGGAPASLGKT